MKFYGLYILWEDPLIVSCLAGTKQEKAVHNLVDVADVIYHPTWLWTYRNISWFLKQKFLQLKTNKTAHFVCSSKREQKMLSKIGMSSCVSSISAYINERDFLVSKCKKEYDAIYTAQMVDYKRMHLAKDIENLYIQTYGSSKNSEGAYDLHAFCPELSHADFNKLFVSKERVIEKFQQSRVGLALSKREGAMLAFVEYLLCGLPVVTTEAEGGREEFYDSRFVKIVEANSLEIAKAVGFFIKENIDSFLIREATIEKIKEHRMRLCSYVNSIIKAKKAKNPGAEFLYDKWYENKEGIFSHFVLDTELLKNGFQLKDESEQKL